MRDLLADRRLHQRGPGQVEAGALGHQHRVAEDRQIGAARDAVAHDRRELRDPPRREHGVVAEDPAEVVDVGEDLVLHRQEDARRIDEVDQRQAVLAGDLLGAEDLLDRHREAGARLDRGVVGDDHHATAVDRADRRDDPARRRPAPLLVHLVGGPQAQLERWASRGRAALAIRSRAVFRPLACCRSIASGPPPRRMRSSSARPRPMRSSSVLARGRGHPESRTDTSRSRRVRVSVRSVVAFVGASL